MLQRHLDGYRIVTAVTTKDAQHSISQEPVCAVITTSTDADGEWQKFRQTDDELRSLPVLSCTWRTSRDIRSRLGVSEYMVKPVSREQLDAALRHLSDEAHDLLIVDDEPEMLRLLGQMIESMSRHYRVRCATDGAAALKLMRESQPDAVILDLLMPGVDGYTVLAEMHADEMLSSIPVCVLTARGLDEETIVATELQLSRQEGLSVAETIDWLKASLAVLPKSHSHSSDREQPAKLAV